MYESFFYVTFTMSDIVPDDFTFWVPSWINWLAATSFTGTYEPTIDLLPTSVAS